MTKSELLVRSILGAVRADIRPLTHAVDIAEDLLFVQHISMNDIRVTKDIYPQTAAKINRSIAATSRCIERLANLCWDSLAEKELSLRYIGRALGDIRAPRDLIIYLAFYLHFGRPFFKVIADEPALIF